MAGTGAEQGERKQQGQTGESIHQRRYPEPECALLCRLALFSASISFGKQPVEIYEKRPERSEMTDDLRIAGRLFHPQG